MPAIHSNPFATLTTGERDFEVAMSTRTRTQAQSSQVDAAIHSPVGRDDDIDEETPSSARPTSWQEVPQMPFAATAAKEGAQSPKAPPPTPPRESKSSQAKGSGGSDPKSTPKSQKPGPSGGGGGGAGGADGKGAGVPLDS